MTIGRVKEKEVEFVCSRSDGNVFVQVAYTVGGPETREREFGALEAVKTTDRKLLLTMDRLDMSDGEIRHLYIPDFLTSDTW